jgi:hypothetical protein
MKRLTLALVVLWLAMLACSLEPTAGTAAEVLPPKPIPSPALPITQGPTETPITPETCTVTAESLHVRDAPNIEGTVTAWLFAGDVANIESSAGAWLKVTTARGDGWIHGDYCKRSP